MEAQALQTTPEQDVSLSPRTCDFCGFTALYSDFPNGSVCFENTVACAPCLKLPKTKEFRAHIKGKSIDRKGEIVWNKIGKKAA